MSIDVLCIRTGGGNWDNDAPSLFSRIVGWGIITPLWIVDIPVSLVTDTLCLPVDIRRNRIGPEVVPQSEKGADL